MEKVMTAALGERAGRRVRLAGWVHHQRHLAHVSFLLLRDASGIAQAALEDDAVRAQATDLLPETAVEIDGPAVSPFYTRPDPDRPEFSNSFDLLFRGLEPEIHQCDHVAPRHRRSGRPDG